LCVTVVVLVRTSGTVLPGAWPTQLLSFCVPKCGPHLFCLTVPQYAIERTLTASVYVDRTVSALERQIDAIDPQVCDVSPVVRERSVAALHAVFGKFLGFCKTGQAGGRGKGRRLRPFENVGMRVGGLVARVSDIRASIRVAAAEVCSSLRVTCCRWSLSHPACSS
jgi:hypothetical protein